MNGLSSYDSPYNQNEFFAKRIRTGRGPEGGLTIRIYPSGELGNGIESVNPKPLWARHSWVSSTQYCVLRLSGFDLLARIYFGERLETPWKVPSGTVTGRINVDSMLPGGALWRSGPNLHHPMADEDFTVTDGKRWLGTIRVAAPSPM
jgi:hypothetical protein